MNLNRSRIFICIAFLIWIIPGIKGQDKSTFRPFSFIQLTDPQFGMFDSDKGFAKETVLYEKAVEAINRLKPDFVIMTGDFVNNKNDSTQIKEFKRITSKIRNDIPVFFIPGNHDIGVPVEKKETDKFIENYGYDRFSFIKNNCLFIGINSCIIKSGVSKNEEEQFEWIKKELEKGKDCIQKIVFTHYPFFINTMDEPDLYSNIPGELRRKYFSLFNQNQVNAVFAGHLHKNASGKFQNTEMITTSALGKTVGQESSGFRIIKVTANNLESTYYSLETLPESITFNH